MGLPHSMVMRPARASETDALQKLIFQTIDACYHEVYPPRAVEFFKQYHSQETIARRIATGHVLAVELEDRLVATGAFVEGKIFAVFVDTRYQGCGLGREVMTALETTARINGHQTVELHISLPSKGFYEQLDYEITASCSDDMGEGQYLDYWLGRKTLNK